MIRHRFYAPILAATLLFTAANATALQLYKSIKVLDGERQLVKPTQVVTSPSGARYAVVDQFANRIYVFDIPDQLVWEVGTLTPLVLPTSACFDGEDALLFAVQNRNQVYRTRSDEPDKYDSVTTIKDGGIRNIDAIRRTPENQYIVLDRKNGRVAQFDHKWRFVRVVADQGQGRGKLWAPVEVAILLGGGLAISDAANLPLQIFSSQGKFLNSAGWNNPTQDRQWKGGAVTVGLDETIWVADMSARRWRRFDRAGVEVSSESFALPPMHPLSAAFTADGRLIVVDELGSLHIFEP